MGLDVAVFPFVTGPSIGDSTGIKYADCLTLPNGGGVSACSGRIGDAQDDAGTRAPFFWFVFLGA